MTTVKTHARTLVLPSVYDYYFALMSNGVTFEHVWCGTEMIWIVVTKVRACFHLAFVRSQL
jgi:hypothetical protein